MAQAKKLFPHVKEFFFDDDTLISRKRGPSSVRQVEAPGADLVLHLARDHRFRDPEGDARSRLPAV